MGAAAEAGAIDAIIPYVVAGETAIFYPGKRDQSYWPTEEHPVVIRDARAIASGLALETNGFVVLSRPTALEDISSPEAIRQVYYPEIEALVKEITGATRVLMFGEIVRSDAKGTPDSRLPARGAHVDYDEPTVQWWVRELVGAEEAERLLAHRHVLINLWRPLATVEKSPLALCDASTVEKGDLNRSEVRGGLDDPGRATMCGFNLQHSPRHRWYYVPHMRPDEIFAFKLCDSDTSRVQWTGHTAFDDPASAADARPRQSIEIRTISFFEN